ncbi:MAG: hypothetical protein AAB520_02665 [Patescibacteria group bacterium]
MQRSPEADITYFPIRPDVTPLSAATTTAMIESEEITVRAAKEQRQLLRDAIGLLVDEGIFPVTLVHEERQVFIPSGTPGICVDSEGNIGLYQRPKNKPGQLMIDFDLDEGNLAVLAYAPKLLREISKGHILANSLDQEARVGTATEEDWQGILDYVDHAPVAENDQDPPHDPQIG